MNEKRFASQAETQITIAEGPQADTDMALDQRLRAGDRQTMNDLPTLLQPRLLQRAYQYVRDYRHILPAYMEALDLVQEASIVILKRLEEARTKHSTLAHLVATGYRSLRQR